MRIFISIIALLICVTGGHNASSILNFIDNQSQTQAHRQSYGYVDIPKWKWKSQKQQYKSVHAKPRSTALPSPGQVAEWYNANLEVDFTCPDEHLVGDAWWLCNPRHLNKIHGCTIYSSGPPRGLELETALADLVPSCDIHVFDPSNMTKPIHDDTTRIHVHPWGFADRTQTLSSGVNNETLELKTIHDTKKELGHRRVDALLLHCGGCEWTLDYSDIPQVLVRVNGVQKVDWFDKQWRQYALFHKQPITVGGVEGLGQSLSYLKLRRAFFL